MKRYFENLAKALLGQPYGDLSTGEKNVIESIAEHTAVTKDVMKHFMKV